MASRKKQIGLVLILFLFTISFFLLQAYAAAELGLLTTVRQTLTVVMEIIFSIMGAISLIILLFSRAGDEPVNYYGELKPLHLVYIAIFAAIMYLVAVFCSATFQASEVPLKQISIANSASTILLNDVLFTFTVVALNEELMKFAGYTYFKKNYGNGGGWRNGFKKWGLALVPMFLWVLYHGILAFTNFWSFLPAFANGMMLLALLELTRTLWAPVIAHGIYNAVIIVQEYIRQGYSYPLFPTAYTVSDACLILGLVVLYALWIGLFIIPTLLRHGRKT